MVQPAQQTPFRPRNQTTGRSRGRGRHGRKHTARAVRKRGPKRRTSQEFQFQSSIKCLALARSNLATLNINGGLLSDTGKLEALMLAATRLHLGVIGLQETHELGIVERTVHDFWGQKWSLHLAGPSQKPRRQGTGFLVSQEHKVIGFHPISSRVSWIELRRPKTPYEGNGKACFVSAYAPTESHSTEQDIEDFYEELKQALSAARASLGSHLVPVMGDFNINLGNDVAGLQDLRPRVLGNSLRIGPSTPNCGKFIAFCNEEGLSILQSWQHARTMSKRTRWCTWCHPGTGQPHMKDFVLLPVEELSATKTCRPSEDMGILTDHKLVVCRINSSKARIAQMDQFFFYNFVFYTFVFYTFVFYNSKFISSLFIRFTFYTFVFYMVRFLYGSLFIIPNF